MENCPKGKLNSSRTIAMATSPVREPSGSPGLALVMFSVLLASYVMNAMDRQLFPLLAPDVRREYGFSLSNIGLISTIFTLGMAMAGLPAGFLLARYSRKTVLQVGVAIFSATTALTVISAGFSDMILYRALTGIGEAMQLTVLIAIAANHFSRHRAAAVGSINSCYGIGSIASPVLGGVLLNTYRSWRVPMVLFGLIGFLLLAVIALVVRPWFTETQGDQQNRANLTGAATLLNRNTVLLTFLSLVGGLVMYGYLGMYPTFLREALKYSPRMAGTVMSAYGLGALASIGGGWLGDRFSPRLLLSVAFFCTAGLGYLLFHGSGTFAAQAILSFFWGLVAAGVLYVNLAACHVKAVRSNLSGRASGIFVTSLYGSAALAGYLMGLIAGYTGWARAEEVQLSLLSLVGVALALALRSDQMSLPGTRTDTPQLCTGALDGSSGG
jgi:DHA1 family inner membrane transport protein